MQSGLYTAGCRDWEDVRCGRSKSAEPARLTRPSYSLRSDVSAG